jgi:hypothetical protein
VNPLVALLVTGVYTRGSVPHKEYKERYLVSTGPWSIVHAIHQITDNSILAMVNLVFLAIGGAYLMRSKSSWPTANIIGFVSGLLICSVGLIGLVTMMKIDGTPVYNTKTSATAAQAVVNYASVLRAPSTNARAVTEFNAAVVYVASKNHTSHIKYTEKAPYTFSVIAPVSQGTNVASACVHFSPKSTLWSYTSHSC